MKLWVFTVLFSLLGCVGGWAVVNVSSYGFRTFKEAGPITDADLRASQLFDTFLDRVLPDFWASNQFHKLTSDNVGSYLKRHRLEVTLWSADELSEMGAWQQSHTIIIRESTVVDMVRTFAHELVRHITFADGERVIPFQNSDDWSGEMGILWNIAETDATLTLQEAGEL